MDEGVPGTELTVTLMEDGDDTPHAEFAVTEIFPLLVPTVTVMLVLVDEPVHPEGKVQL